MRTFLALIVTAAVMAVDTTGGTIPVKDGICHVFARFADGRIELTVVQVKDGHIAQPIDFTVEDWAWCTVPWLPRAAG